MKLHVQTLMRDGMSPSELLRIHGVRTNTFNGKTSFSYAHRQASRLDPVANQCRGLVLRANTWELLAYPFDRFFSPGESGAASVELSSSRYYTKLDGTLLFAYWADGEWHAATRSQPEAQHGPLGLSFRELTELACQDMLGRSFAELLREQDRDLTLMFELTAPENRVVCEHEDRRLTLLGARRLSTAKEINPEAVRSPFPIVDSWDFSSLADANERIAHWSPAKHEGLVVCDAQFNRLKLKTDQYIFAHGASDSLGHSWSSCMKAAVSGLPGEVESCLPHMVRQRLNRCRRELEALIDEVTADYSRICHLRDMREFASAARASRLEHALYAIKRGQVNSVAEFLKTRDPRQIVRACAIPDAEASS